MVTPSVFPGLSAAQRKFAHSLRDFKFEFIGDAETDDERCIGTSRRGFRWLSFALATK